MDFTVSFRAAPSPRSPPKLLRGAASRRASSGQLSDIRARMADLGLHRSRSHTSARSTVLPLSSAPRRPLRPAAPATPA